MKAQIRIVCMMLMAISLIFAAAYAQEISPSPLPTRPRYYSPYDVFPATLFCENIDGVTDGPTWGEITIGGSSVEDLRGYLRTIANFDYINQWADYISFGRTGALQDKSGIPHTIGACLDIDTQTVMALSVSINGTLHIEDLVTEFGIPDVVTWGTSSISRTLIWFNEGVAALVYVLDEGEILHFGAIELIVYFPYQANQDFEERWPFNRTSAENLVGGDELHIPPPPDERNPFNFEAMAATMTAEPDRTPSWILHPTPIATIAP